MHTRQMVASCSMVLHPLIEDQLPLASANANHLLEVGRVRSEARVKLFKLMYD